MKKKEYLAPEAVIYLLNAAAALCTSDDLLSDNGPGEETERAK